MDTRLLLLADSRLPAGGHAHSGGVEPAATAGAVTDLASLSDFLAARLSTAGLVTAALAAASCSFAHSSRDHAVVRAGLGGQLHDHGGEGGRDGEGLWRVLDAEVDARTPSPAQRTASRAQGRALLRVARTTWPHPALDALAAHSPRDHAVVRGGPREQLHDHGRWGGGPHHPVVLGAAAAAAGGTPRQAAAIAAYGSVTGAASAAVRLLGLDPLAVQQALAVLADDVDAVAARAAAEPDDWAALPAVSAPGLDLLAELHLRSEVRLFES
ncbi:urease accessory protein UreF [Actinomadura alba]|uniref:Urease accessory protein UreF n=1 Tax=Actinomadura alba TaxID=406431 RepID=A0ABR7LGH7_9ACTN|nr:urease accessory UreF family protein [Actinomadura alba]MBC6463936.1 urease accessory protein UreF [Actinomadura alba]